MQHFNFVNSTHSDEVDARDLLMTILEPLLGERFKYNELCGGVNMYLQTKRWRELQEKGEVGEDAARFLAFVTKGWKKAQGAQRAV
jgi:hypothetical protein